MYASIKQWFSKSKPLSYAELITKEQNAKAWDATLRDIKYVSGGATAGIVADSISGNKVKFTAMGAAAGAVARRAKDLFVSTGHDEKIKKFSSAKERSDQKDLFVATSELADWTNISVIQEKLPGVFVDLSTQAFPEGQEGTHSIITNAFHKEALVVPVADTYKEVGTRVVQSDEELFQKMDDGIILQDYVQNTPIEAFSAEGLENILYAKSLEKYIQKHTGWFTTKAGLTKKFDAEWKTMDIEKAVDELAIKMPVDEVVFSDEVEVITDAEYALFQSCSDFPEVEAVPCLGDFCFSG